MAKPKAGTLASLPGFVPWHSQLAHTIPNQVDEKGFEPTGPHPNFEEGGPPEGWTDPSDLSDP